MHIKWCHRKERNKFLLLTLDLPKRTNNFFLIVHELFRDIHPKRTFLWRSLLKVVFFLYSDVTLETWRNLCRIYILSLTSVKRRSEVGMIVIAFDRATDQINPEEANLAFNSTITWSLSRFLTLNYNHVYYFKFIIFSNDKRFCFMLQWFRISPFHRQSSFSFCR